MIDLHAHVLPGVDDGPATLAESVELLHAAADGIERIAATPHVRADHPTAPETMERLVAAVRAAVADAGVPVEVLPGGELDLQYLEGLDEATLRRFGLGGNPRLLLVEAVRTCSRATRTARTSAPLGSPAPRRRWETTSWPAG